MRGKEEIGCIYRKKATKMNTQSEERLKMERRKLRRERVITRVDVKKEIMMDRFRQKITFKGSKTHTHGQKNKDIKRQTDPYKHTDIHIHSPTYTHTCNTYPGLSRNVNLRSWPAAGRAGGRNNQCLARIAPDHSSCVDKHNNVTS